MGLNKASLRLALSAAFVSGSIVALVGHLLLNDELASLEEKTISRFSDASPSVVSITPLSVFRDAISMNLNALPQGMGSGFIWSQQGIIVTNMHVVSGADALHVTLHDQSTWPAQVIGVAPDTDLAVLRIKAPPDLLKPIELGTSAGLRVGLASMSSSRGLHLRDSQQPADGVLRPGPDHP